MIVLDASTLLALINREPICLFLDRVPTVDEHVGEHVALLRAIAAGDTDRADDLARGHVLGFEKTIRAVI